MLLDETSKPDVAKTVIKRIILAGTVPAGIKSMATSTTINTGENL